MSFAIPFLVAAAIFNTRSGIVPNWLIVAYFVGYFVYAYVTLVPYSEIGVHLFIFLGVLLGSVVLHQFDLLGGGAGKLLAVTALWLEPTVAMVFLMVCAVLFVVLLVALFLSTKLMNTGINRHLSEIMAVAGIATIIVHDFDIQL